MPRKSKAQKLQEAQEAEDSQAVSETSEDSSQETPQDSVGAVSSAYFLDPTQDTPEDDITSPDEQASAGATPATEDETPPVPEVTGVKKESVEQAQNRQVFPSYPELFSDLPPIEQLFPSYTESMRKRIAELVAVESPQAFKGCITLKYNFAMSKKQRALVPRWFYMQHSSKLNLIEG